MFALVSPDKIKLPPGAVVRLPATWQEYENLCQQRGDGSIPRVKYRDGEVLLMSPLPVHGRDAHLLAQIVIALLDHSDFSNHSIDPSWYCLNFIDRLQFTTIQVKKICMINLVQK
jgi:Uma2 family endonuclease